MQTRKLPNKPDKVHRVLRNLQGHVRNLQSHLQPLNHTASTCHSQEHVAAARKRSQASAVRKSYERHHGTEDPQLQFRIVRATEKTRKKKRRKLDYLQGKATSMSNKKLPLTRTLNDR